MFQSNEDEKITTALPSLSTAFKTCPTSPSSRTSSKLGSPQLKGVQVVLSAASEEPGSQRHENAPSLLSQRWAQPPLFVAHSSMSKHASPFSSRPAEQPPPSSVGCAPC